MACGWRAGNPDPVFPGAWAERALPASPPASQRLRAGALHLGGTAHRPKSRATGLDLGVEDSAREAGRPWGPGPLAAVATKGNHFPVHAPPPSAFILKALGFDYFCYFCPPPLLVRSLCCRVSVPLSAVGNRDP